MKAKAEPFNPDKLSKDRRDWLEIFGNQWGPRRYAPEDVMLTDEHKAALTNALNPFHRA
jgi:hypothetical protein